MSETTLGITKNLSPCLGQGRTLGSKEPCRQGEGEKPGFVKHEEEDKNL